MMAAQKSGYHQLSVDKVFPSLGKSSRRDEIREPSVSACIGEVFPTEQYPATPSLTVIDSFPSV